jgi:hypothetical protein
MRILYRFLLSIGAGAMLAGTAAAGVLYLPAYPARVLVFESVSRAITKESTSTPSITTASR